MSRDTTGRRAGAHVSFRPMEPAHLPAIRRINRASTPGVSLLEPHDLVEVGQTCSHFLVAVVDRAVVGYAIAFADSAPYEGDEFVWFRKHLVSFLHVDQIAVAPENRSQGIGEAFYDEFLRIAALSRCRALACGVNLKPPNPRSLAFHTRLGFEVVAEIPTREAPRVALLRRMLGETSPRGKAAGAS